MRDKNDFLEKKESSDGNHLRIGLRLLGCLPMQFRQGPEFYDFEKVFIELFSKNSDDSFLFSTGMIHLEMLLIHQRDAVAEFVRELFLDFKLHWREAEFSVNYAGDLNYVHEAFRLFTANAPGNLLSPDFELKYTFRGNQQWLALPYSHFIRRGNLSLGIPPSSIQNILIGGCLPEQIVSRRQSLKSATNTTEIETKAALVVEEIFSLFSDSTDIKTVIAASHGQEKFYLLKTADYWRISLGFVQESGDFLDLIPKNYYRINDDSAQRLDDFLARNLSINLKKIKDGQKKFIKFLSYPNLESVAKILNIDATDEVDQEEKLSNQRRVSRSILSKFFRSLVFSGVIITGISSFPSDLSDKAPEFSGREIKSAERPAARFSYSIVRTKSPESLSLTDFIHWFQQYLAKTTGFFPRFDKNEDDISKIYRACFNKKFNFLRDEFLEILKKIDNSAPCQQRINKLGLPKIPRKIRERMTVSWPPPEILDNNDK